VGLAAWDEPVEEEQPASSSIAATRSARLTEMKPRPPGGNSDVRARLASIDRDARSVEEARLLRADEHDHARDLLHRPEPPQRHVGAHKRGYAIWIRLLPPVP